MTDRTVKTVHDRMDELEEEAQRRGLDDRIHQPDFTERLLAYADMLGYSVLTAENPNIPLRRIKPPEK